MKRKVIRLLKNTKWASVILTNAKNDVLGLCFFVVMPCFIDMSKAQLVFYELEN
jgi:hypothetical protein